MSFEQYCSSCVQELRDDHERGAGQLARAALGFLAQGAREWLGEDVAALRKDLDNLAHELQTVRPSMVPIEHLVGQWRHEAREIPAGEVAETRAALIERAQALVGQSQYALAEVGRRAAELVPEGAIILTHSLSSTVREVFGQLQGKGVTVLFSEARPRLEGHRLAQWLSALDIRGELFTDAQLGHFAERADLVFVGADSVFADGAIVNKAGSYLLALAAHDCGVPFYACFESFKRTSRNADEFELEEMDPAELDPPDLPGIRVRNVYFDITPARLVSAWIDEDSVHRAS